MARSTSDPAQQREGKQPDFVQRGKVLIVRRQFQEAVKICRLGLLAHPTYVEGRLVLGMSLMALSRYDEVLAEMRVALELEPQNAIAYLLKGEALFHKHDFTQAKEVLLKAQQLDPQNAKIRKLLEELADVDCPPMARSRTETKVYPAQRAQSLGVPREPGEVLAEVRLVPPAAVGESTTVAGAMRPKDLEEPTEPDPLVDRVEMRRDREEGEEDEYSTAPFLPPKHLAGVANRKLADDEDWEDDQTVAENQPPMVQGLDPRDTVERSSGTVENELPVRVTGTDPAVLAGVPLPARPTALPQWDTSDAAPGSEREASFDGLDEGADEGPTVDDRPGREQPDLAVLFASAVGQRSAAARVEERETVVNADLPPPEALFGEPQQHPSSNADVWSTAAPRSSADPTKAVDLEAQERPDSDLRLTVPAPLPRVATEPLDAVPAPASRGPTAASLEPSPLRQSSDSQLMEISVEMLPDEMPPLPSDARAGGPQPSDIFSLPPTAALAASPQAPGVVADDDDFATRVNFDPVEDGRPAPPPRLAFGDQPAPRAEPPGEPGFVDEDSFTSEGPAAEPALTSHFQSRGLQPQPTYLPPEDLAAAGEAPLRGEDSFGGPGGLRGEDSFGGPGEGRGLRGEDSFGGLGGLRGEDSFGGPALRGQDGFAHEPLEAGASYSPPEDSPPRQRLEPDSDPYESGYTDGFISPAPSRRIDQPRREEPVPSEPAPARKPVVRAIHEEPRRSVEPARAAADEARRLEGRGPARARTAALEDEGRAYPYADQDSPSPRRALETSPERPRAARPAFDPRRAFMADAREDSGLSPPPELRPASAPRRRREPQDRTHTSFLTLLIGEPGSHRALYLAIGAVGVLAAAVGIGLAVRYLRLGEQIEQKRRQALARLRAGNFADYAAAAQSYADILARRPRDMQAVFAHARIQAAIPFEFGDANPGALRAPPEDEGENRRHPDRLAVEIYKALSAGELERAAELVKVARESRPDEALLHYLEGRVRLLQGMPVEAERSLELATRLDPSDPLYLRSLGEAMAAQRRWADARDIFQRALRQNPFHVASLLGLARIILAEGGPLADVQRELSRVAAKAPSSRGQRGWMHLIQAELLFRQGQVEAANKAMSQARANAPAQDPFFWDEMARVLIDAFQLGQAEMAVKESKRSMPGRPHPFFNQARIHFRNGLFGPALAELAQARSLGFAAAAVLRAQIHLELNQLGEAEKAVQQALSLGGDLLDAYMVRARILAAQRSYAAAVDLLNSLIKKNPNNSRLVTALGEVYMAEGKHDLARNSFRLAMQQDSNAVEAKLKMAKLLELEGKWQEAKHTLEHARRASYGNVSVQKQLARLEADTGDLGEAVSNYQHVLGRVPGDTGSRLALIRVLTLQREFEAADQEIKRAQAQRADPAELALAQGRLALARGKPGQALALLESARAGQRSNPELWDLLVRARLDSQDERGARRTAAEMSAVFPGSPEAELTAARVEYASGQLQSALRRLASATQALARIPRPPVFRAEVAVLLGRVYQDSGNGTAANEEYQRAAMVCNVCPDPHFYRGLLLDERGSTDEALRALEQTVKLDPKRAEAFYWLGVIRERLGQIDQAREAYTRCLALHPTQEHRSSATEALKNLKK